MSIRVRFAPSPTGPLHIGATRTALFNYLFAKKHGGKFVLRIEDTDLERSDSKFEKDILEGLQWLEIEWDEGPAYATTNYQLPTTNYGPYRQSERTASYKKYIEKLLAEGKAFYCFHSEKELEEEKEKLMEAKRPVLHLCEYRTMDPEEADILKEAKPNCIIRFKTPAGRKVVFKDLIRGEVSFESDLLGDFSVAKNLETPLYNFAVVVDDHEMTISHVIRGEDHISNTPKQLLLIEALGFKKTEYAHLPLILGPDRSKLSKRHGVTSVNEYRNMGYLPETMFNFMALLGWNPGDDNEIFSREELIKKFSLEKVQKSGAVFDLQKLDWMNGEYIRKLSPEKLYDRTKKFFPENYTLYPKPYTLKVIVLEQSRLKKLSEIGERTEYFFRPPEYEKELLRWKDTDYEEIAASLDVSIKLLSNLVRFNLNSIEKMFLEEAEKKGDRGKLLWPLRVALSGKKASPGPFEIMEILGKEESLKRLEMAKTTLRGDAA
ncbi:MAG: glutamate--tRNA ligase [Candidatus Sungbacteria bacterium RIFCSPHIGHO2_02_FULL_47_11]|uniref:Glutamate--tRNA ligase n=1 Tax=Candidatus Sungbacteria bacterium RIFCSPHIGHO2_02_FULL_47_11 TaxID=1802270 RepID=A0A1G2KGG7_9BACT|nr:MAG: glutamate--tRNA ligase [Candidatus Sungbacteria bacterium RIFCSPHIGHO2_02_FULL_47_11]